MPNLTQSAPGRRTRERILDATLGLFNERGEPAALLDRFVGEFNAVLPPAGWRADHVEDAWLLLHLLLETVWRYRFLFRDLSGVMARDRRAAQRIAGVFSRAVAAGHAICLGQAEQGTLTTTAAEIDALAENVAVVALYWLSFESARHPRQESRAAGMSRGADQVLMLVAPFLQVESRVHLERLALEYLARH